MKKILLISLVTVLAVSLVGCGENNNVEVDNQDNVIVSGDNNQENNEEINTEDNQESNENVDNNESESVETEDSNTESNEKEENNSSSQLPEEDNTVEEPSEEIIPDEEEIEDSEEEPSEEIIPNEEEIEDSEEEPSEEIIPDEEEIENSEEEPIVVSELEAKINTLIEKSGVMIRMPMASPIEAGTAFTFIGLTEDEFNTNVANATAFESMIMPANQSVCLVELKENVDVTAVKQKMIDNCDPNKWICMSADKCLVVDSGKYVLLVMSTAEDCDALKTTFANEFGNVGEALTK